MSPEEICDILKDKFTDGVTRVELEGAHPYAVVAADRWLEVAQHLRDDADLKFNMLLCITALDLLADNKLACVYDFISIPPVSADEVMKSRHTFAVRVEVDRDNPHIPSIAHLWPAADWHEREAFDMMGIFFDNHPDLRRILCPDDWDGHPLRKDYNYPLEYHGIPGTTEYDLPNPRH